MAELAVVYAALILNDDGIEITSDKLNKLIQTAGVKLESYWIDLFAEYFKTHNVTDLVKGGALGGAAPAGGASTGAAEETKEEEKKEEEEVVEMTGGFDDLFD
ncbi:60S acidic ribosomal protein P1 [Histomonas meleagridis]|uniref:60S acidic ribosomal protein P1 n=1 Tax=Histomonas meleagridis TaxID=135588 RepID=UPI0035596A63|nr:60S acidic ribosomal protein P1 [Histomonas meleagridis]KAH0798616.1 60S acidic ribosomal protein P1 [Histomonas meleagridis]